MSNFITPVCMQVTQEQYEEDLKHKLIELGYTQSLYEFYNAPILISDNENSVIGNTSIGAPNFNNAYPISQYNPQLFLALAAMSNNPNGIKGEWWMYQDTGWDDEYFTVGNLYKQITPSIADTRSFVDDKGQEHSYAPYNLKYFRKATKEELIEHFSNTSEDGMSSTYETTNETPAKRDKTFPIILSPNDAQRIINLSSGKLRVRLIDKYNWAKSIVLGEDIVVSEKKYRKILDNTTGDNINEVCTILGVETCKYNVGDYIVYSNGHEIFHIDAVDDRHVYVTSTYYDHKESKAVHYFGCDRHEIKLSEVNSDEYKLWSLSHTTSTDCVFLVSDESITLHYCDGWGNIYPSGIMDGVEVLDLDTLPEGTKIIPFDIFNLPYNKSISNETK